MNDFGEDHPASPPEELLNKQVDVGGILVAAHFKKLPKNTMFLHTSIGSVSNENKEVLSMNLNVTSGAYVFHKDGERYELDLQELAKTFIEEMDRLKATK